MLNNQMLYDRRMTVRMDRDADRTETRSSRLPEGLRSIGMGLGTGGNPLHDIPRTFEFGSTICFCSAKKSIFFLYLFY